MPSFASLNSLVFGLIIVIAIPLLGCQTLLLGRLTDSSSDEGAETTTSGDIPTGAIDGSTGECAGTECELCTPSDHLGCSQGDVYWFDSCGVAGEFVQACGADGCANGACEKPCAPYYEVLGNACDDSPMTDAEFTMADGSGPGGGESMIICAVADYWTGYMQIRVKRHPGALEPLFEDRRYDVRVSQAADGDCGPETFYFDVADNAPVGVGTADLSFNFAATWLEGQTEKAYCVTAAMKPGDMDYDAFDPTKQSWWWSDKITVAERLDCD